MAASRQDVVEVVAEKTAHLESEQAKVKADIEKLVEKVEILMRNRREEKETLADMQSMIATLVSKPTGSGPIGPTDPIKRTTPTPSPASQVMEVTSRPIAHSAGKMRLAPQVQKLILSIASLETTPIIGADGICYVGAIDALVDLILTARIGFEHGIRPIPDDSTYSTIRAKHEMNVRNYGLLITTYIQELLNPALSSREQTTKRASLNNQIMDKDVDTSGNTLLNFASLFHVANYQPFDYQITSPGTKSSSSKPQFIGTYLGQAWFWRLPKETRELAKWQTADPATPVPRINIISPSQAPAASAHI